MKKSESPHAVTNHDGSLVISTRDKKIVITQKNGKKRKIDNFLNYIPCCFDDKNNVYGLTCDERIVRWNACDGYMSAAPLLGRFKKPNLLTLVKGIGLGGYDYPPEDEHLYRRGPYPEELKGIKGIMYSRKSERLIAWDQKHCWAYKMRGREDVDLEAVLLGGKEALIQQVTMSSDEMHFCFTVFLSQWGVSRYEDVIIKLDNTGAHYVDSKDSTMYYHRVYNCAQDVFEYCCDKTIKIGSSLAVLGILVAMLYKMANGERLLFAYPFR